MELFTQQVVDGIAWGSLYGALALSLVLVYRASGIVNFAQGEMAMFAAFVTWQLHEWGIGLLPAILLSMVLAFIGGAAIERVLIRPLAPAASQLTLVIITLGLMLLLNNGAGWIWDFNAKQFPAVSEAGAVTIGTAAISRQALAIVLAVIVVSGLLFVLFRHTRLGLSMRAAASNPESARLVSIPVGRVMAISWGLAAAIGALVASLAAPQLVLQPNMLAATLIYAFAAAVLGGLDSPVGALVGGLIVGISENLAGTYIPGIGNDFKQAIALVIIMAVLLFRAEGLFGAKRVVRV
ncbi:MAG: branched-chain amino acid ABC transporter permease [Aeromicrobium sp.]